MSSIYVLVEDAVSAHKMSYSTCIPNDAFVRAYAPRKRGLSSLTCATGVRSIYRTSTAFEIANTVHY